MKPIGKSYQLCHGSNKPDNAENGLLIIKLLLISQNMSVWIISKKILYLIGLEGYRPTCGDLEHMSAYLSALVNTLLVTESSWVIRSWKIVLSTKSSYGSHQICNSFSTIAEIIKQGVGMENSLEEMVKLF
ncbi:unnamed protein product [Brassica oleracea]